MNYLLDTHVLLWAAYEPRKLSATARKVIEDRQHKMFVSVASLWEIAIKASLGRPGFDFDARVIRRSLHDNGYCELAITGEHAAATIGLPAIHRDPFDRMLVAQSIVEGITLLTSDEAVARYPGPIQRV